MRGHWKKTAGTPRGLPAAGGRNVDAARRAKRGRRQKSSLTPSTVADDDGDARRHEWPATGPGDTKVRRNLAAFAAVLLASTAAAGEAVVKVTRIQNGLDLIADVTVRNTGRDYLRGEIECNFQYGGRSVAIGRAPLPQLAPKSEEVVWVKVEGRDPDATHADCRFIEAE